MDTIPLWVTLLGFAAPLLALAGSAVAFVVRLYQDAGENRRNQFFELMQFIDSERPIATKVAAVYELRRFPKHREFIIRFCEGQQQNVKGDAARWLIEEFQATAEAMRRIQ